MAYIGIILQILLPLANWHAFWLIAWRMLRLLRFTTLITLFSLGFGLLRPAARAGGGPFNTFVIVNARSTNSLELGAYYCERRQIPPENVLRIDWPGNNIAWSLAEFQNLLFTPLQNALASRQITGQVQYVVLSMDIPFQVISGTAINSTTSVLFYGFKGPTDLKSTGSAYTFSEAPFESVRSAPGFFLATMLTAGTLAQAKQLVDRGVACDGTFPTQQIVLAKTSDALRNQRHRSFDAAISAATIDGRASLVRTNADSYSGFRNLLGLQTGLANFSVPPNLFVPGAIADSMTSFGGIIFGPNGQTTLLALIHAGATASYGTVTEPSADPAKFPDPMVYFYQARGFNIAESYYQSIPAPYLGLIVGDPLAAPFARPASGQWIGVNPNQVLSGTAPLSVQFLSDRAHPIHRLDLFVDGRFHRTLTNIAPSQGNVVNGFMQGRNATYTVRNGDTPNFIASSFAGLVNIPLATNLTGVSAAVRGDRLILTRFTTNVPPRPPAPVNIRSTAGAAVVDPNPSGLAFSCVPGNALSDTTIAHASRTDFHESAAHGLRTFTVSGAPEPDGWLRLNIAKINGSNVVVSVTNQSGTATSYQLTAALAAAVGNHPELRTADGIAVDDLSAGWFNSGSITFRARTPGLEGAEAQLELNCSPSISITPTNVGALNQNASDLLPRNHVYIATGLTNLSVDFALETTQLEDGHHDLTVVAYEGSHVRTQSPATIPILVRNGELEANLEFSEPTNTVPLAANCTFRVTANQNVSSVTLSSTGGVLGTILGQNPAIFTVSPSQLGAGRHPFFAIVTTAAGNRYRTAPLWIEFQSR